MFSKLVILFTYVQLRLLNGFSHVSLYDNDEKRRLDGHLLSNITDPHQIDTAGIQSQL